ncbi:hypothetical protein Bbelb_130660 [Branchiostoma belcheri]|nr:hypothetical protein Bbelb_130660 [Branchiostoma belcheri]
MDPQNWPRKVMTMPVEGLNPRGRPKKNWVDSIREDIKSLKLQKANPLDRGSWRAAIRPKRPKRHPTTSNPCTTGNNGRVNEYLASVRDVPRIERKMEVPWLGEPHPTHIKEPTALIEKNRRPARLVNMPKMGKDVCCHAGTWMADNYEERRREKTLI